MDVELLHSELESTKNRVSKVENTLDEIKKELKEGAVHTAKTQQILELVQKDTSEIRNELLNLMYKIMDKNNQDDATEKQFYRKVIIGAISVFVTIVLAVFGIKELIFI